MAKKTNTKKTKKAAPKAAAPKTTKPTKPEEPKLFPTSIPVPVYEGPMKVSELPEPEVTAPEEFVTTVQRLGVVMPLILRRERGKVRIIDGRKRNAAARKAGLKEVPVRVFDLPGTYSDAMLVIMTEHRGTNWIALFDAVVRLLKVEKNENALARALGIDLARVRKLLTLRNLIAPLEKAWRDGKIADTVAFSASKLNEASQKALATVLKEKGALTASDVGDVKGEKEETESDELDFTGLPTSREELKDRLIKAIMAAREKGPLEDHTPAYLAEYLTRVALGESLRQNIEEASNADEATEDPNSAEGEEE